MRYKQATINSVDEYRNADISIHPQKSGLPIGTLSCGGNQLHLSNVQLVAMTRQFMVLSAVTTDAQAVEIKCYG